MGDIARTEMSAYASAPAMVGLVDNDASAKEFATSLDIFAAPTTPALTNSSPLSSAFALWCTFELASYFATPASLIFRSRIRLSAPAAFSGSCAGIAESPVKERGRRGLPSGEVGDFEESRGSRSFSSF